MRSLVAGHQCIRYPFCFVRMISQHNAAMHGTNQVYSMSMRTLRNLTRIRQGVVSTHRFPHTYLPNSTRPFSVTTRRNVIPIPFVTETQAGGVHHTTDLFSKLLKERIVCVYGAVDEAMAARVTASLLFLEADNPSAPISMYIDSPGGSVTSGLAIYDTMQYVAPAISTIALGSAMSMGSLLLAAGHPGKRYCLPHSSIMTHQPSGGYSGQTSDILIHAKHISKIRDQLNHIYLRHLTKSGLTIKDVEDLMERDNFLDAQEAHALGLVDEVLQSRKQKDEKKDD